MGALSRVEDVLRQLLAYVGHEGGCPGNGSCECGLTDLIEEAQEILDDGEEG